MAEVERSEPVADNHGERLGEIQRAIAAHPGSNAAAQWGGLRCMHAILSGNFRELGHLLNQPSANVEVAFELIQNVNESPFQEEFALELDRRLHNVVAAAGALIDHTRRVANRYPGSDFATEYERRKETLKAAAVVLFIKDLRDYTLHYRLPSTYHHLSFGRDAFDFSIRLSVPALLQWPKWSKVARAYLEERTDGDLVLKEAIAEYGLLVDALYTWFFAQFDALHEADIEGANRLIDEYNHVLTGRNELAGELRPDR